MSEPCQIAIVQVNAIQEETLQLDEVIGRVPTAEIVEVLNSDWAKENGWQALIEGKSYLRQLAGNVGMEFQIETDGDVKLKRQISEMMRSDLSVEGKKRLQRMLDEVQSEYNLAFNEVIGKALILALPRQAAELGYEVVEENQHFDQQTQVIDMELKMRVYQFV